MKIILSKLKLEYELHGEILFSERNHTNWPNSEKARFKLQYLVMQLLDQVLPNIFTPGSSFRNLFMQLRKDYGYDTWNEYKEQRLKYVEGITD